MTWEAVTAIGTVLSAVVILLTVILGVRQLGGRLVLCWRNLLPVVAIARAERGNGTAWENAEYLSREAEIWLRKHPPK
ncbi:MAG: hypothetical protein ABR584_12595 [Candidatus Baltobacteraceae bacterium]